MLHTFELFPNLLFRIEPLLLKKTHTHKKATNGNIVNSKIMQNFIVSKKYSKIATLLSN